MAARCPKRTQTNQRSGTRRLFKRASIPADIIGRRFRFESRAGETYGGIIMGWTATASTTLVLHTSISLHGNSYRMLRYSDHTGRWTFDRSAIEGSFPPDGERRLADQYGGTLRVFARKR